MFIQPWALLGAEIDVIQEQPLPWNAPWVHVTFHDGPDFVGPVRRCPGDLLYIDVADLPVRAGTPVQIQWTQKDRGGYAAGIVVETPESEAPGVYIHVEESATGVERRLGVRLAVQVAANVISPSGIVLPGRTTDLSLGGARIAANPTASHGLLMEILRVAEKARDPRSSVVLTLPAGIAWIRCLVISVGQDSGDVRVRFIDNDGLVIEQIGALLRAEQRRIALRGHTTL